MKNKKVIALDVDGVITDIGKSINIELEKTGDLDVDYTDWLLNPECKSSLCHEVMDNTVFWMNLRPFVDAWHQVNKWFYKGFDIHLITARRSDESRGVLNYWLDGWDIPYNKIHICEMGNKASVASELSPVFMVEDNPSETLSLVDNGVTTYLRKNWHNQRYWYKEYAIPDLYILDNLL
jgi:uncharacterized HAD superfamily protein